MLRDKCQHAGQVSNQGNPTDVFQIPDKVDFLHTHDGYAGSGTDDEYAAARAGTVGDEAPEIVVKREAVHANRGGNQRNVIHYG